MSLSRVPCLLCRHACLPVTESFYYDTSWRVVEVRDNDGDPVKQYVWGLRYIDSPIARLRNVDASADDSLEETLYYTNDANYNVTAMVDTSGTIVERYHYDPYGTVTVLHGEADAAGNDTSANEWSERTADTFANEVLYCGYRYDPETGMYSVRHRTYHPTLGRWIQRDPLNADQPAGGYHDGMNVHEYVRSGPTARLDPMGRQSYGPTPEEYQVADQHGNVHVGNGQTYNIGVGSAATGAYMTARSVALGALDRMIKRHRGYLYFETDTDRGNVNPLKFLLWRMQAAVRQVDAIGFTRKGPAGTYKAGHMRIPLNGDPTVVVHESMHALNDMSDKFQDSRKQDEAIAHATMYLYDKLETWLQPIEDELNSGHLQFATLRRRWRTAWLHLDIVGYPYGVPGKWVWQEDKMENLEEADLWRLARNYGIRISCQRIADLYNAHKALRRDTCWWFTCDPLEASPFSEHGWPWEDTISLHWRLHSVFE